MKNKTVMKWLSFIAMSVFAITGLNILNVQADSPKTDVIITKVETEEDVKDMDLKDLAGGVDLEEWFNGDAKVLPGVSFTYFEVSDEQLEEMDKNPGDYDTAEKVTSEFSDLNGETTSETDDDGQVTLSQLEEGNYWIVENKKDTVESSKAVPFGLTLPFTNEDGSGFLEKIHVYPKNTLEDTPDIDKEVDESNVLIGNLNTWTVSIDIPKGIEDYKKYGFVDEIDERLDFEGTDEVKAVAEGIDLVKGDDYTVEYDETTGPGTVGSLEGKPLTGILTVMFTEDGREKLKEATSEDVKISFQTRVNEKAVMGQEIFNTASLEFDNGHGNVNDPEDPTTPPEEPEVHTGGKAFVKKDKSKDEVLEGAEFIMKNDEGEYIQVSNDKKEVTFVDSKDDATTFTSDGEGKFEIKGLPYGEYILIETKAPEGYALPTNPETEFTVDKNSYHTNPDEIEVGKDDTSDNEQVINNKKMSIPQTGGMGTLLFTIIGGLLMTFAVVYYRKTAEA